jgi:hypothetical protein
VIQDEVKKFPIPVEQQTRTEEEEELAIAGRVGSSKVNIERVWGQKKRWQDKDDTGRDSLG